MGGGNTTTAALLHQEPLPFLGSHSSPPALTLSVPSAAVIPESFEEAMHYLSYI